MSSHDDERRSMKSLKSFVSGGTAGVISKSIIAPIERVKYLFIVNIIISSKTSSRKFSYQQFYSDFLHIIKVHGFSNLWRGNLMNVARIFPHAAIVRLNQHRISQCLIIWEPNSTKRKDRRSSKLNCFYVVPQLDCQP